MAKGELSFYLNSKEVITAYFFIYSFNLILLCIALKQTLPTQIFNLFNSQQAEKKGIIFFGIFIVSLFGMAGIPPFMGFLGKFIMLSFINQTSFIMTSTLVFLSSIFVFIYIRPITYYYRIQTPSSTYIRQDNQYKNPSLKTSFFIIFLININIIFMFVAFCHVF